MRRPQARTVRLAAITAVAAGVAVSVPVGFVLAEGSGDHKPRGGEAAADCHLTQLELPDGVDKGAAEAVSNENGYIAGGHEWLWQDEYLTVMEGVQGDVGNEVNAVNSDGTVVGTADGESDYGAWSYQDGTVTRLLEPGGDAGAVTYAEDVNDAGAIVGSFFPIDSEDGHTPLIWEAGADTATALPVPEGGSGRAVSIAADGSAVGMVTETTGSPEDPSHRQLPWLWTAEGEGGELPLLPDADRGRALSISGDWVLMSDMADDPTYYRWNRAEAGEVEPLTLASATDIDATGRVFGSVDAEVAGYQDADGVVKLPNVAGQTGAEVRSATDEGRLMVGTSGEKPVLWFCG